MNAFWIYQLKAAIGLGVFILFYLLFFKRDTFFYRNRGYLLASIILSLVLPVIPFSFFNIKIPLALSDNVENAYLSEVFVNESSARENHTNFIPYIILIGYIAGAMVHILRTGRGYYHVFRLIRNGKKEKQGRFTIVYVREKIRPFSLFNYIVMPSSHRSGYEKILRHEMIHGRQYHSWDIVLMEMVIAIQWVNPAVWLYKRMLVENHEFTVDDEMIHAGENKKDYQYLLLEINGAKALKALTPVNEFNCLIKSRIKMMKKKQTSKFYYWKSVLVFPVMLGVLFLMQSFATEPSLYPEVFPPVEDTWSVTSGEDTLVVQTDKDKKRTKIIIREGEHFTIQDLDSLEVENNLKVWHTHDKDGFFIVSDNDTNIIRIGDIVVDAPKVIIDPDTQPNPHKITMIQEIKNSGGWTVMGDDEGKTLYLINGKEVSKDAFEEMDPDEVKTMFLIKGEEEIKKKYKKGGFDRAVEVKTHKKK